jgi:integrase
LAFSTPLFYTFFMEESKSETVWETTNVTNLLRNRQSGSYYARVKVNGKQKWRTLRTTVFSVAKLRLGDIEKEVRAQGLTTHGEAQAAGTDEMTIQHFIGIYRERTHHDASIKSASKERRDTAIKAVVTTWPELPGRDIRRLTGIDCREWAAKALREGTGFIAPNVKTKRKGMSASAFNKSIDALRAVLEIAREKGVIYKNPANEVEKAPAKQKRLNLPNADQFKAIVKSIATSGSKWSEACADMVRLLAYSGARLEEATASRWQHVDLNNNQLTLLGTKTGTSYRIIPLFPDLKALLSELRARRGEESSSAPILKVGRCLGALETACSAVGVAKMTHHDLRHLFATRCIESGVDIPTVSRWLGHADGGALAMKTYGHLRQEHSQAQALKVTFG